MSRVGLEAVTHERVGHEHLAAVSRALDAFVDQLPTLERWGRRLAIDLLAGNRLLVAGNGGSAAHAQHLASELVGRYRDERVPLSAIALHAESSPVTAIVNDYGAAEVFARQVRAHGRPRDVLLAISTSGRSENLLAAVDCARQSGLTTWALTASSMNALRRSCDESVTVASLNTATVQEVHQVAIHILCEALDQQVREVDAVHCAFPTGEPA